MAVLDKHALQYLLVIHTFMECKTTSAIYEKGKTVLPKLITKSDKVKQLCSVFMKTNPTQEDIENSGI